MVKTHKSFNMLVITMLFIFSTICLLTSTVSAADKVLKVGAIAPLSGPGAPWGKALVQGVELAIDDIQAKGGLVVGADKYKIELLAYDDKYSGKEAVDAANRLIFNDKINIIFGSIGSAPVNAFQVVTEPNKVLVLANSYARKTLGADKPYTYRVTMTSTQFAPLITKWLLKSNSNLKKAAILGPNDESGWGCTQDATEAYKAANLEIVYSEFYERGLKDFYPYLTKILMQKPDIIDTSASASSDSGLLIKQARELGFKGMFVAQAGINPTAVVQVSGKEYAEGYTYAAGYDLESKEPKMAKLYNAYQKKYGIKMTGWGTPAFYDGAMALFHTMEKTKSIDTTVLKDNLEKISDFEGIIGQIKFIGNKTYGIKHQIAGPGYIAQIKDGKEVIVEHVEIADLD